MPKVYLDIETFYIGPFYGQELFRDYANHQPTVIGVLKTFKDVWLLEQAVTLPVPSNGVDAILHRKLLYKGKTVTIAKPILCNTRKYLDGLKQSLVVGYNCSRFDLPILSTHYGFLPPYKDLMYLCWRYGLYGGLKAVCKRLRICRPNNSVGTGEDAMHLWREYVNEGKYGALETLLKYNEDDVLVLPVLEKTLFL